MMRAVWASAQGLRLGQARVEATAHNLANLQTPGFKALVVQAGDLGYQTFPGAMSAPRGIWPTEPVQLGSGSRVQALRRDLSQGVFVDTESHFDLAIDGPGYFRLQAPGGETVYTRNGSFGPDETGQIVNHLGYRLMGAGGTLPTVPTGAEVVISATGEMSYVMDEEVVAEDQLLLATFASPESLLLPDDGMLRATDASGPARPLAPGTGDAGLVRQGFLEVANTDLTVEMVSALTARRAYEFCARNIRALDDMWRLANDIRA